MTVLGAARIAGIQAAKRTSDLIPLCHPLLVGSVYVNFTIGDDYVEVETQVETFDRTGVEMEALTSCAVAALTVYDMCKSVDRTMSIGELRLLEKTGGRSGSWRRVERWRWVRRPGTATIRPLPVRSGPVMRYRRVAFRLPFAVPPAATARSGGSVAGP